MLHIRRHRHYLGEAMFHDFRARRQASNPLGARLSGGVLPFPSQGVDVFTDQPQRILRGVQKLQPRPIDQAALPVGLDLRTVDHRADHPAPQVDLLLVDPESQGR